MAFNKLVRDRIPEIIGKSGKTPVTRVLDADEYRAELRRKLLEETNEYLESGELEELADILTVLRALCKADGHTADELEAAYAHKLHERGGFDERIYLICAEDKQA